jgi:hypothetical protein
MTTAPSEVARSKASFTAAIMAGESAFTLPSSMTIVARPWAS